MAYIINMNLESGERMQIVNFILLVVVIVLLLRINSKLPGRDLVQEAVARYEASRKKDENERRDE